MYRALKILSNIFIILAIVYFLFFIGACIEFSNRVNVNLAIHMILLSPTILCVFFAVIMRLLYKELCADKLSTINMLTEIKKEIAETNNTTQQH